jgi:hypothetical protein
LEEMLESGEVEKIGLGYVLVPPPDMRRLNELGRSVRKVLSQKFDTEWIFPYALNIAGCYLVSDPDRSHEELVGFFEPLVKKFQRSMFWLDDLLVYAIEKRNLSPNVLDTGKLQEVWNACFGSSNLIVFAFAIRPPELLSFLTSGVGRSWSTRYLEEHKDSILRRVEERRFDSRVLGERIKASKEKFEKRYGRKSS